MDFQYCDRCGDISSSNHGSGHDHLCAKCAGSSGQPAAPKSGLQLLEDPGFGGGPAFSPSDDPPDDLDLFSSNTLAIHRDKPKSTKLRLVDAREGSSAERKPGSAVLGVTQPIRGPLEPAAAATDRWRVDCLHCGGSLSVRPVPKRSKLRCPRCRLMMVLDPSGQVNAIGSSAQPKSPPAMTGSTAAPPNPMSVPSPSPFQVAPPSTPKPNFAPGGLDMAAMSIDRVFSDFGGGSTATAVAPPPATAPVAGGSGLDFGISPDFDEGLLPETTEELASALLGEHQYSSGAMAPPTRIRTRAATSGSTVSTFRSFFWITLALLPSLCGVLAVHDASGSLGDAFLGDLGITVRANAGNFLDWCANLLGR